MTSWYAAYLRHCYYRKRSHERYARNFSSELEHGIMQDKYEKIAPRFKMGYRALRCLRVLAGLLVMVVGCNAPAPDPPVGGRPGGPCQPKDDFCVDGRQDRAECVWIDDDNVCLQFESYRLHYAWSCERGWFLVSDTGCPRVDMMEERSEDAD